MFSSNKVTFKQFIQTVIAKIFYTLTYYDDLSFGFGFPTHFRLILHLLDQDPKHWCLRIRYHTWKYCSMVTG
jgi:hypothetical protein